MRFTALSAVAALLVAPAPALAQPQPEAAPVRTPAYVNVDEPVLCNAAGLAPSREQASGYAIPADKGGGSLAYVDDTRAECHQVVGKKPSGQYKRPTICPLGSGRTLVNGAWVCRTQKLATTSAS